MRKIKFGNFTVSVAVLLPVLVLASACSGTNSKGDTRLVVTPEARRAAETAQQPSGLNGESAEAKTLAYKDPDEVICRYEDAPTGTRLGKRKICATRAEWDQMSASAREETLRIQDASKTCISGPACSN